jgi:hypothetical protein
MLRFHALPRRLVLLIVIGVPLSLIPHRCCAQTQDLSKRLILKDGSYQSVTKYEIHGDRVRYFSTERDDWEELPSELVDWPATEKYEKGRATSAIPEAAAIDKETDAEREADEARLPEVAPGLRLPDDSGVYLLDNYQGQPQVVEMQQAEGEINPNARANVLRQALGPAASAKETIELDGAHAAIHSHVTVPSIYVNVEDKDSLPPTGETASAKMQKPSLDAPRAEQPQQPEQPEQPLVPYDRFRIVQLKEKGGKRIVGDLKRNVAGKVTQEETIMKTTIDRIKGGWLRLSPVSDLAPGEYAVIETQGPDAMNLYVWDFSVDPKAPANANPYKPEVKDSANPATNPPAPR